jgi:phosphoribosyl 1,2-cyclic phosphodiesterase
MHVIPLQSGDKGNCIYVDAGSTRLLFDAGISAKQAQERLACEGRDVCAVDALLISHDHLDHSRSMGIYQRKSGLPVYVTPKTLRAAMAKSDLGHIAEVRHFQAGETLRFGRVRVETIPTPHDADDGVVFVVDDGRYRLGILTDLGHVFGHLHAVINSLSAVLLESNFDPEMLGRAPYPRSVKDRIRGPGGHISNFEAAELLLASASRRLQWCCLAHLSELCNTPQLALQTHRRVLRGRTGLLSDLLAAFGLRTERKTLAERLPFHVASRDQATQVLKL